MRKILLTVAASSLATVLLIGGIGFVAARSFFGPRVAEAAMMAPWAAEAAPEFQGLRDLPPAERFGHFLGGSMKFTDANNAARGVTVTPGTVTASDSGSLTIKPNDEALGKSKKFTLGSETRIHAVGTALGSQATPKVDDKVVVITLDGSDTARGVIIGGPDGFAPQGGPWPRGPRQ